MSMHLAPIFLTTNGKTKKKPTKSKKKIEAAQKHEAWLVSYGIHSSQINARRSRLVQIKAPDLKVETHHQLSNSVGNGYVRGVMANLHKETPAVREQILEKANRCVPLYNKGGYQFATDGMDQKTLGSRTRR